MNTTERTDTVVVTVRERTDLIVLVTHGSKIRVGTANSWTVCEEASIRCSGCERWENGG